MRARIGALALAALLAPAISSAVTLEAHNRFGAISVRVVAQPNLVVRAKGVNRLASHEDTVIIKRPDRIVVRCEPKDEQPIDLEILLPLGYALTARTEDGDLVIEGMIHRVSAWTTSGDVLLRLPWGGTHIVLDVENEPKEFVKPDDRRFRRSVVASSARGKTVRYIDALPQGQVAYGHYSVRAVRPKRIVFEEWTAPEAWPIKFPWQAPAVVDSILRGEKSLRVEPSAASSTAVPEQPSEPESYVIRADVRMVNFVLAVNDQQGRPAPGLGSEDFEVFEDEEKQNVTFAGSDDVPFNLAILLDLSGSTEQDREHMQAVAERFVAMARPHDRVAVYTLAGGMFHVISPLTDDRRALLQKLEHLPKVSGASPLYDMVALAYDEELRARSGERNAMIVISDGIDNQVSKQEAPSAVSYKKLARAAEQMDCLIYPIFLRSGERFGRNWSKKGRKAMSRLAEASGGRLFPALSIRDLEPVFDLVEAELRSVYSVAYYPSNQDFDGSWRKVEVRLKKPKLEVRARQGYYGR